MLKEPQAQEKSELLDEDVLVHNESDLGVIIFNSFNFLFTFDNGDGVVGIFFSHFCRGAIQCLLSLFFKDSGKK